MDQGNLTEVLGVRGFNSCSAHRSSTDRDMASLPIDRVQVTIRAFRRFRRSPSALSDPPAVSCKSQSPSGDPPLKVYFLRSFGTGTIFVSGLETFYSGARLRGLRRSFCYSSHPTCGPSAVQITAWYTSSFTEIVTSELGKVPKRMVALGMAWWQIYYCYHP